MASTYESTEPQAAEAAAPDQSQAAPKDLGSKLVMLPVGEAVGACDVDGECR